MKFLFKLSFLFSFFIGFSQYTENKTINIVYNSVTRPDTLTLPFSKDYVLRLDLENNKSYYDEVKEVESESKTEDSSDEHVIVWKPKGKNLDLVYKNYNKNELFSKDIIGLKFFLIKDSLSIFNWKIHNESKEILGYKTQLATTTFRGRDYKAWFASELPAAGPWKFDGLPGLILSIESLDKYLSINAIAMNSLSDETNEILDSNPFEGEKYLSWQDFKDLYKKKAISLSKYKTPEGESLIIVTPRITIERYIEEDDTDYMADKNVGK